jgi:hypothetical protein
MGEAHGAQQPLVIQRMRALNPNPERTQGIRDPSSRETREPRRVNPDRARMRADYLLLLEQPHVHASLREQRAEQESDGAAPHDGDLALLRRHVQGLLFTRS